VGRTGGARNDRGVGERSTHISPERCGKNGMRGGAGEVCMWREGSVRESFAKNMYFAFGEFIYFSSLNPT